MWRDLLSVESYIAVGGNETLSEVEEVQHVVVASWISRSLCPIASFMKLRWHNRHCTAPAAEMSYCNAY